MSYDILFSPKSRRQIKGLKDEKLKEKIKEAVIEIGKDPWHKGTIKVEGYENIRRKRVGRYRILYMIDKQRKEVLIVKIEKRSETTYK
ncbi:type II toxin-antitoxin system RelE/ParE family toxin [Candidatus Aciduliprofundum boonei]|uniref:Plasmid stabilization system n=1 Tax=Aciduliprofundum boonei (strain DSM 19572 / T469) TaxID=439481 RepID=D3T9R2_ACIB4|nr:type II toxin-antitoxin system RelE/ParE family toxin [Candidatus Aciduliprofundum boonei]ADD08841.1 plasmid stabilization system [Aciduliprofundum boonei T469]HII55522.1 type II toxin-antitoxin system RelE/ParE family toxin [Candidatus Aciduliprofundum boonei]